MNGQQQQKGGKTLYWVTKQQHALIWLWSSNITSQPLPVSIN